MSPNKILKQTILASLKENLNEYNIDKVIQELKFSSKINFDIEIRKKGYKL